MTTAPRSHGQLIDRGDPPEERLSLDSLYHVLQNERRRMTLQFLVETGQTTLGDIADQVAAWEHDTTVAELPADQRKRVYISLYQSHLPTLADHAVVEYDSDTNTVTPKTNLSRFEPYLDVAGDGEREDRSAARSPGPLLITALLTALAVLVLTQLVGPALLMFAIPLVLVGLVGMTVASITDYLR